MFCFYGETYSCFLLLLESNCSTSKSIFIIIRQARNVLLFQLRPNMERYQQAMVNIMTRRASPQQARDSSSASSQGSNIGCSTITINTTTLTCPAGTPQDPSYLTIPFTAPSEEPMTAKEPKRPKEQEASMFIAGTDSQLIIGMQLNIFLSNLVKQCACSTDAFVLSQVVMGATHYTYRKTQRGDTPSLVTRSRASHSARDVSRSRPSKCGASRTLFPSLTVFPLSKIIGEQPFMQISNIYFVKCTYMHIL